MKIRNGFVSNSSSSSFIIQKKYLLPCQIAMIHDHIAFANLVVPTLDVDEYGYTPLDFANEGERWGIGEDDGAICMYTCMDNFDMHWFLKNVVRVPTEQIETKDY